ncbi:MAG: DUF4743 domain-containing protein [Rhodospirillaceae bacterium]
MTYIDHINACNACNIDDFVRFRVGGVNVGWVHRAMAARLSSHLDILNVTVGGVDIADRFDCFKTRTDAMAELVDRMLAGGQVPKKRGEQYPVLPVWGAEPLLSIDRAVVAHFGITAYGVHVNGFVRGPDGIKLWIGRRSADRTVAPGKLDNLIAGGQPVGLTLAENLVKEAYEEAAIGPELAGRAVPAGVVTYMMEVPIMDALPGSKVAGLKVDCLFNYDLELPANFVPRNVDGEVAGFELLPWRRVAAIVRDSNDFKFNCNLVVIDFLIRHGLITPEEPGYLDMCRGLRCW